MFELAEAADSLHTSPALVMDLVAQGKLRPMRAGATLMFVRAKIERLATERDHLTEDGSD